MVKTIYYTVENGIRNLEWVVRDMEAKFNLNIRCI